MRVIVFLIAMLVIAIIGGISLYGEVDPEKVAIAKIIGCFAWSIALFVGGFSSIHADHEKATQGKN